MKFFHFSFPAGAVDHVRIINTLNKVKSKEPSFWHGNTRTETGYQYKIQTDNTATAFRIGLAIGKLLPPGTKLKID